MKIRRSPQTFAVLYCFAAGGRDWQYGYDISRSTGLKSGTLYPLLMRLEGYGLLETKWETTENGRPPRHMYRLTGKGVRYAREQFASVELNSLKEVVR